MSAALVDMWLDRTTDAPDHAHATAFFVAADFAAAWQALMTVADCIGGFASTGPASFASALASSASEA
jgi:hypothetical protein